MKKRSTNKHTDTQTWIVLTKVKAKIYIILPFVYYRHRQRVVKALNLKMKNTSENWWEKKYLKMNVKKDNKRNQAVNRMNVVQNRNQWERKKISTNSMCPIWCCNVWFHGNIVCIFSLSLAECEWKSAPTGTRICTWNTEKSEHFFPFGV